MRVIPPIRTFASWVFCSIPSLQKHSSISLSWIPQRISSSTSRGLASFRRPLSSSKWLNSSEQDEGDLRIPQSIFWEALYAELYSCTNFIARTLIPFKSLGPIAKDLYQRRVLRKLLYGKGDRIGYAIRGNRFTENESCIIIPPLTKPRRLEGASDIVLQLCDIELTRHASHVSMMRDRVLSSIRAFQKKPEIVCTGSEKFP